MVSNFLIVAPQYLEILQLGTLNIKL